MPDRKSSTTRRTAQRLRQLAKEKKLSVNRFADFAGVGRGYLSRLLRAEQSPTLDTLEKLAAVLDVEVRDLVA